jgi:hypothetical protein
MGSMIEINDTLQITAEQGFPSELQLEAHLKEPIELNRVAGKVFEFRGKSGVRNYQQAPVRCFLAENREGKWIYWGLIQVIEVTHDYVNKTTSGKYRIIYLNTPDQMRAFFDLTDRREGMDFFGDDSH